MIYPILPSLYTWLDNISNLNIYNYYNSLLDISKTYNCSPSLPVPNGTLTFIVVDTDRNKDLTELSDTLVNRYVLYANTSTFVVSKIRITNYNSGTGEITIESAFGETLTTSSTFSIVFLDTLFIDVGGSFQSYRKKSSTETVVPIYLQVQTKEDGDREKIFDYMYLIEKDFLSKGKRLAIYDSSDDIRGYMKCYGSVGKEPTGNYSDQLQKYLMNFDMRYSSNFR